MILIRISAKRCAANVNLGNILYPDVCGSEYAAQNEKKATNVLIASYVFCFVGSFAT